MPGLLKAKLRVALPAASSVPVPMNEPASKKETDPPASPPIGLVTWAVSATPTPTVAGLTEDDTVVVVAACWTFSASDLPLVMNSSAGT